MTGWWLIRTNDEKERMVIPDTADIRFFGDTQALTINDEGEKLRVICTGLSHTTNGSDVVAFVEEVFKKK